MKTVILFAIVGAALAAKFPPQEQQFLNQVHQRCQANPSTYCNEDLLKNLGNNRDNTQVGIHMLCMSKGAGFQTQNGDIDKNVLRSKILMVIRDQGKANEITNKCGVPSGTDETTAVTMWICLVTNQVEYIPEFN
ncbi:hypothetical protein NQ317_005140 [Molorchus minor]|uniref:Uncharacterized protein n=1 Tax=Molorchus minor TaxID=1323400 RepID=A0ABQ9JLH6_9CUCU|nr:hypothetical protein NQ317_005140 [Molorchus minor]